MRDRTFRRATAALALLAGLVTAVVATQVFPYHSLNHDEGVYLQQAAMLLEGQVFLRPPMEDAFRPWFFVEDGDRLYSKYAPVPAAMFALGELFGAYRLALVAVAAGNVALVALVVREVFDEPTGLLAAGLVLASPLFVLQSGVFLPYAPTTLLNLAFAYAYLRADRTRSRRWAAVAGAAVGLAFFSRPYTAVLFAAPFVAHALWTLSRERWTAVDRLAVTAALGLCGVAVTLAYNAVVTGSPWVFPYQAFAPLDGLGFGHRRLLNHEVVYTPELAFRANRRVVSLFFTEWLAGGLLTAALALYGVGSVVRRGCSARAAALGGLFVSVVAGNVYFWGNFNILGVLDRAGDGLIAMLGPYYHFDLLVPTAAFAAVGALTAGRAVRRGLRGRLDRSHARVAFAVVLVLAGGAFAAETAGDLDDRVDRNLAVTETYADAYAPFADGAPANAVVLLPDPYGDWLNHPFQVLRNDPGFDARTVYALHDRPFAVANEFPDRSLYRYVYRGVWNPLAGSPDAARLQRVRDVTGEQVRLNATVGVPAGAVGVTARVATDDGSAYYVGGNASRSLDLRLVVSNDSVRLGGDLRPTGNAALGVSGRDVVRLTVFVDYGAGGGFAYRFDLPVDATGERVRALSPRVEYCRNARACGGAAAYVPAATPEGVFVRTVLVASEPNA